MSGVVHPRECSAVRSEIGENVLVETQILPKEEVKECAHAREKKLKKRVTSESFVILKMPIECPPLLL